MLCYFLKCVLSLSILVSFGHSYYFCNWKGETWENAMKNCHFANGTLLTAEHFKEIEISGPMKAYVSEFWTSNIIEVAHAVEYKGCYEYLAKVPQNNLKGGINLIDCQSVCHSNINNYPFYGLYQGKCVCIYGEKVELMPSNQSCFKNCNINSMEFCEDSKLIALYKQIGNDNTKLSKANLTSDKCVARFNMTNATKSCQRNLQYQCNGTINNGTFMDALDKCGEKLGKPNNTMGVSWVPVFFPTLNTIKKEWIPNQNLLKKICKSLKIGSNQSFIRERECDESLPYVCKTEYSTANSRYFTQCAFRFIQTTPPSTAKSVFSTKSDVYVSTESYIRSDTYETTSDIKNATTMSHVQENLTDQFSTGSNIHSSTVSYKGSDTYEATSYTSDSTTSSNPEGKVTDQLSTKSDIDSSTVSHTGDDTYETTSYFRDSTTTSNAEGNVTYHFSTRSDIDSSTVSHTQSNTYKATTDNHDSTVTSRVVRNLTEQSSSCTGNIAFEMSSKSTDSESTHTTQTESKSTATPSTISDNHSTNHVYKTSSESHISSTSVSVNTEQEASTRVNVPNDGRTTNIHLDTSETVTSSTVYKNNQHNKSQTAMIVGIACGGSVLVLTVIIVLILRKRCIKKKKKLQKDLDAVHFQTVSDHEEDQDMDIEDMSPYSFAVSVGQNPVLYQGNNLYAVVNKTKQADDRNGESYPLASRASGTTVQNERKGGITNIYAVVNKNKKETSNGKEENYSGNDINIDGSQIFTGNDIKELMPRRYNDKKPKRQPGDDASYSLSTGTDYDHLNFRGSKNTSGLPNEADALYDHANCGLYDGVQHDVKQRGISDTYDHV